jgi:hypothetical protein
MRSLSLAAAILGVVLVACPAWADNIYPPAWRGQPGTTFEQWEFSTSNPITPPDIMSNPYGLPSAHAWPGTSQNWVDLWGGRQGMWPLSGTIEITIPNRPEPLPYKDIWVQLTWARQVQSSTPVVWEMNSGVHASVVHDTILGPTGYPTPNEWWYHTVFQIHLQPNPSSEVVKIDGTLVVDQVVIDTICAPEPASLGLLLIGGVALLRRR